MPELGFPTLRPDVQFRQTMSAETAEYRWNFQHAHDVCGLKDRAMHLSNQSLLVIILVGLIAGWAAGRLTRGSGFGLAGDLIVGLLGALIGEWLLPQLHIHLGVGIVAMIVNALIGALVLLLILRLFASGGWGYRRWGARRW